MKYFKHIFLAIVCLLAFGGAVLAEPTPERKLQVQEKIQEIKLRGSSSTRATGSSTREEVRDRVCSKLSSRIDGRISHFGERFDAHLNTYNLHKEKLTQIETKLSSEGVDTTKLKADISTLDTKISTFSADANKVKEALENTQSFSCGNSDGAFRSAVESLRTAQKVVRTDAQDIHDFITQTLIKDIQELRALNNKNNEQ
jgi:hypothetical protein